MTKKFISTEWYGQRIDKPVCDECLISILESRVEIKKYEAESIQRHIEKIKIDYLKKGKMLMKEINKIFYRCEYCGKEFYEKDDCTKHEVECKKAIDLKKTKESRRKEVYSAFKAADKAYSEAIELQEKYNKDYVGKSYFCTYSDLSGFRTLFNAIFGSNN